MPLLKGLNKGKTMNNLLPALASPNFHLHDEDEVNKMLETALGKPLKEVQHQIKYSQNQRPYQGSLLHSSNSYLYVVIPFRNRKEQLLNMLPQLESYFQVIFDGVESFGYTFVLVEQSDSKPFNKGILFNIATVLISQVHEKYEAEKHQKLTPYICFHDVDVIPRGRHFDFDYCASQPCYYFCPMSGEIMHLYGHLWSIGGVFSIRLDDYVRSGGFSNCYWGWGWEDNDFQHRCQLNYITINRTHFSERLTGASSFKELDKIPIDLHTSIPEKMTREDAVTNKKIYDHKLKTSDFNEGLAEATQAFKEGKIRVLNDYDQIVDLDRHILTTNDKEITQLKNQLGEKLIWYKIEINTEFVYSFAKQEY